MKVCITGDPYYPTLGDVRSMINNLPEGTTVICRCDTGVSSTAAVTACERELKTVLFSREQEDVAEAMVDMTDMVIAFYARNYVESDGLCAYAKEKDKPILTVYPKPTTQENRNE